MTHCLLVCIPFHKSSYILKTVSEVPIVFLESTNTLKMNIPYIAPYNVIKIMLVPKRLLYTCVDYNSII